MATANAPPWTLGRLLDWTAKHLAEKGAEFPRLDAEVLLAHAQGCRRIDLYTRHGEEASEEVRAAFRELVKKRVEGCPVAYLVGRKEFYLLALEVSPAVLIPRPDTETLVEEALALAKPLAAPEVIDVGTGSGAIAIAVARNHPGARVTATDLSPDALAVARRNAEKHGVGDRIRFLEGDLLAVVPPGEAFDLVLSNPPYVPEEELSRLPVGVRDFEPRLALDGGPGGFAVLRRLTAQVPAVLRPGGYFLVEIGVPQEVAARELIGAQADLGPVTTLKDGSGHPRVLKTRRRG
jgi:release factor glutamine methyltransferase